MIRLLLTGLAAPLAPVLALAACGQPVGNGTVANNTAKESGYIARVLALPQGQRDGVLFRAIRGGGGPNCQGIAKAESQARDKQGRPVWLVTCTEGSIWVLALADDGTAYVTNPRPAGSMQ